MNETETDNLYHQQPAACCPSCILLTSTVDAENHQDNEHSALDGK